MKPSPNPQPSGVEIEREIERLKAVDGDHAEAIVALRWVIGAERWAPSDYLRAQQKEP